MCGNCGCGPDSNANVKVAGEVIPVDSVPHTHSHSDTNPNADPNASGDAQPDGDRKTLQMTAAILAKNDQVAQDNRARFKQSGVLALNLMSSPGAGKTALLERTIREMHVKSAVVVGDLATDNDAVRLQQSGAEAIPITTGNVCHLEASMVSAAVDRLDLETLDLLFIENVGNLVCPVAYDLGEAMRVVLFSVTEGEDKPLKYPATFKSADVVLMTKTDLAEAVGCDLAQARNNIHQVAPQAELFEVSARSGIGMTDWYFYLQARLVPTPNPDLVFYVESDYP